MALIAVVTAIALLTAGSLSTSILAEKTTGSLSKFIRCIRGLSGTFIADIDDCYDTVYNTGSGSVVDSSGTVPSYNSLE